MHPSPLHLPSMTTTELREYREELLALDAEHGGTRYLERAASITRILEDRAQRAVLSNLRRGPGGQYI